MVLFRFGLGFGFGLGRRDGRWRGLGDAPLYAHSVRPARLERVAVDGINAVLHTRLSRLGRCRVGVRTEASN